MPRPDEIPQQPCTRLQSTQGARCTPAARARPPRPPGLYEELVTRRLEAALEEIRGEGWRDEVANLDPAEAPGVLARFVHDLVEPLLGSLTGKEAGSRGAYYNP